MIGHRIPNFEAPQVVGVLEEGVLEEVRDQYCDERFPQVNWQTDSNLTLLGPLLPLAELVLESEARDQVQPSMIRFDFDLRPIGPGETQRSGHWHIDGTDSERPSYAVASALPTEFFVLSALRLVTTRKLKDYTVQHTKDMRSVTFPDHLLSHGSVLQPSPREVVAFSNHIHRSARNNTGATIPRTWIRAAVFLNE